jgi:ATP-dependent Clp protease ATP-binding subunit ClpA
MPRLVGPWEERADFNRFSPQARAALSLAQEEARRLRHNYIGTEHLLLGMVHQGEGGAASALDMLGVSLGEVRAAIEHIIGSADRAEPDEIALTPRAKKALALSQEEARRLRAQYVGTEHLLLGLTREGDGIAANVLKDFGVTLESARAAVARLGNESNARAEREPSSAQTAPAPKNNVVTCRLDDRTVDALDSLVEAGIRSTRSDAVAWLVAAGIEAHRPMFDRLASTIQSIRQLRLDAQAIAREISGGESAPERTSGDEPGPEDAEDTQQR